MVPSVLLAQDGAPPPTQPVETVATTITAPTQSTTTAPTPAPAPARNAAGSATPEPNTAPTAGLDATPNPAVVGESVRFEAYASADADGRIVRYEWDFDGDKRYEDDARDAPTTTHVFTEPGSIVVRLRVTDDDGATAEGSMTVRVQASPSDAPVAVAAGSSSVTIRDFEFGPATITVHVGDTVTWTNDGPSQHTATATDGSFDTGLLSKGSSGSARFSTAGSYSYICTPHPFMKGTVKVVAASSGGGSGSSDSGSSDATSSSGAVTSTTDTTAGTLPNTGTSAWLAALIGLALLGAGIGLRVVASRRDRAA